MTCWNQSTKNNMNHSLMSHQNFSRKGQLQCQTSHFQILKSPRKGACLEDLKNKMQNSLSSVNPSDLKNFLKKLCIVSKRYGKEIDAARKLQIKTSWSSEIEI